MGYENLSDTPQKIREILALRASGWTIYALSIVYKKDRTSIRHHLVKYSIQPLTPEVRVKIDKPAPAKIKETPHKYNFDDEPINPGHSYKDYVALAQKRHPNERWHQVPSGRKRISDIMVDVCQ